MYFFDETINAFLVEGIHNIPANAINVSEAEYDELIAKRDAGCELYILDGKVKATPPRPSDGYDWDGKNWEISAEKLTALLTDRKTALLQHIADKTDQLKAQYLQGYSQAEIDSFYRQEREARGELPLMLLTELFEGRDDLANIEQLKEKVIEKADLFAIIMGKTFAVKQNFETHIEQAQTLEELENISKEIDQWQSI
ncbi:MULTISPECIES: phage tail protein [unclassified Pasteurella]|uniref:phage tail protein n=1 Tax=unclassified Pasteurella TaxID=2621516 RepID=UPI0010744AD0|nr:phage tail protein [Pasteurella sp. 19428wF3_WM03]TFU50671.1 phage tail protein [Pasteurella sp. WM03]